jgi:acyl-CoA thioesterase I
MKSRALWFVFLGCGLFLAIQNSGVASADAATIVALGASNTYGKGVARNQAYPAQLEAILRAKGLSVHVVNAGINGDTTEGMLGRLASAVPNGTSAVILQPAATTGARAGPIAPPRFKAGLPPGTSRWSCSATACLEDCRTSPMASI